MGTWLSLLHLAEEAGKEPTPEAPHQVGSFGPLTPMAHVSGFGVEVGRVPKPPRGSIHVPKEGDMGTWENTPWSWVILNVPRTLSRADHPWAIYQSFLELFGQRGDNWERPVSPTSLCDEDNSRKVASTQESDLS